ncbi:nucleolar complex protein 14 [Didymella pomorum]|uniref:Nucleolar complex protein 14 n=1 Tax=Didymella pomorum TaxID=749634 RepID=A0A9W9DAW1_9PLEO|nr:nucleolar complex protein 14 [Didymella pomorum]
MPPSQLKRLKASLRDQGITGPQKSKKEKKSQTKNAAHHAQKASALASIRESFNPFEFKHLSRPQKFEYATTNAKPKVLGRPGVTKSAGEETRRKTLLPEMNRKNKIGGILDRRIGENDPTMSLEDRMMARFEREQLRKRGGNVFDLEDGDEEVELTHGGQTLRFDDEIGEEDYDAASVSGSGSDGEDGFLKKKRRRDEDGEVDGEVEDEEEQPERKKTKAEVMKEVIAKSKLHKYERQQAKEDDEDLREELDKDLSEVLAALRGHINKKPEPEKVKEVAQNDFGMNADRAALLATMSQDGKDKEYDRRVRELFNDERSKPTERTKTAEERAKEEADRLKKLEENRQKRMRGEPVSDDEEPPSKQQQDDDDDEDMSDINDDAAEFGLAAPPAPGQSRPVGVDDEDDFILEDDLLASDSEADISDEESDSEAEVDDTMAMDDDDADFLKDVVEQPKVQPKAVKGVLTIGADTTSSKLAYTYPCPRSHEELLDVFKKVELKDTSLVIQRIRALYHAGLKEDNKHKLADFACALVDHVSYLSNQTPAASLSVIESIIRHIHSISRSYPVQIATQFRKHLKAFQLSNQPTPGDLALLTAIGSIYPTSDHFHQVVTPAVTLMARWMGLTTPSSSSDIATGAFIGALCLQYQALSKRYIPEFIRYTTLCLRSPHATKALLTAHTRNILSAADLWSASPAFTEIFTPFLEPLQASHQKATLQNLRARLNNAKLARRPQTLHFHRPLPIPSRIPKFEESFDPTKHYDADQERSDAAKLQKEYKRERKGAMRELRKDANFIAREKLREKKEKDAAYEAKYKKLVAEIQGEEGYEKNQYEKEKRKRKGN